MEMLVHKYKKKTEYVMVITYSVQNIFPSDWYFSGCFVEYVSQNCNLFVHLVIKTTML